jgi:hypothetical protein
MRFSIFRYTLWDPASGLKPDAFYLNCVIKLNKLISRDAARDGLLPGRRPPIAALAAERWALERISSGNATHRESP